MSDSVASMTSPDVRTAVCVSNVTGVPTGCTCRRAISCASASALKVVIDQSGYPSPAALRKVFRLRTGLSLQAWRTANA